VFTTQDVTNKIGEPLFAYLESAQTMFGKTPVRCKPNMAPQRVALINEVFVLLRFAIHLVAPTFWSHYQDGHMDSYDIMRDRLFGALRRRYGIPYVWPHPRGHQTNVRKKLTFGQ